MEIHEDGPLVSDKTVLASLGGRKFIVVLIALIFSGVLVWFKAISDTSYASIVLGVVLTYVTGNVIQKSGMTLTEIGQNLLSKLPVLSK